MKKIFVILFTALIALVSCSKTEIDPVAPKKAEQTGLVAVTMKLIIPQVELQAETRAKGDRSDQPNIKDIRVAVFGTSGYPQAYALAEPIVSATDETAGSYATTNGDEYFFKVLLPVYDGKAYVHVIANGDESIQFVDQDEASIMENMKTTGNVGAYWARVVMPDGILTQLDQNGIMQTDDEGNFIPSSETAHLFEDLVLVRNFAEVVLDYKPVEGYDNLSDMTWTLVNVPTMGSVAPMAAGTFVDDFKDYEYDPTTGKMKYGSKVYDGFMFREDELDLSIPAGDEITHKIFDEEGRPNPNFVYERYYPTDKATCILLKAKYKNQTDGYSYYRIDLMDESVGGYYPIYRNYKYQVTIKKVGNKGASTPEEAMRRDSGGNISQTQEAKKLTDISDGSSRLFVEYIEKNFTSGGPKTFWVYYIPDVTTGVIDNGKVSVRIKPNEAGNALKPNTSVTKIGSSDGKDIYQFVLKEQDENADLVSKLEVIADNGKTGDDKSTLYRDITLRVMKKMDMTLSLDPKKVTSSGETTVLKITLPAGLPSSMFPLEFLIEDVNHALAPTGYDYEGGSKVTVPVKVAKSLADEETNSYYYIRTVNEDEYTSSPIIQTQFKTNKANSATTIYVDNEYFKMKSINLLNDGIYVNPLNKTVKFNVTSVDVEVEMEDQTKTWTVSGGSGVDVVVLDQEDKPMFDEDGETPIKSGTGTGKFRMTFSTNESTTDNVQRTATVSSTGVDSQTVTITQSHMEFSVSPEDQLLSFSATSATVTVHGSEGKTWTATVTGTGATLVGADEEGKVIDEGTKELTINFPANVGEGHENQKTFVVTVTMADPEVEVDATITQDRGPDQSASFGVNDFTYNISQRTGSATAADGFIKVDLASIANLEDGGWFDEDTTPATDGYAQMGRRGRNNTYRGTITVTPKAGEKIKITRIRVTYSNETYAGYDFGNTRATSTPEGFAREGNTNIASWNGSSTGAVTITNGYNNTGNNYSFPRITNIEVTYEPTE